jgi:DNA-binding Xre family transcriptional regulator
MLNFVVSGRSSFEPPPLEVQMSEQESSKQPATATDQPTLATATNRQATGKKPGPLRGEAVAVRLPEVLVNLDGLGRALVQLRVRSGISQRELARRTGVHESQVSRDEKGAYGNATVGRLQRIIEALEARLVSTWEQPSQG